MEPSARDDANDGFVHSQPLSYTLRVEVFAGRNSRGTNFRVFGPFREIEFREYTN